MNDAINMGMDTADDEQEAEKIYDQICTEIGIDIGSGALGEAGKGQIATGAQPAGAQPAAVDDLQARLDNLNR